MKKKGKKRRTHDKPEMDSQGEGSIATTELGRLGTIGPLDGTLPLDWKDWNAQMVLHHTPFLETMDEIKSTICAINLHARKNNTANRQAITAANAARIREMRRKYRQGNAKREDTGFPSLLSKGKFIYGFIHREHLKHTSPA